MRFLFLSSTSGYTIIKWDSYWACFPAQLSFLPRKKARKLRELILPIPPFSAIPCVRRLAVLLSQTRNITVAGVTCVITSVSLTYKSGDDAKGHKAPSPGALMGGTPSTTKGYLKMLGFNVRCGEKLWNRRTVLQKGVTSCFSPDSFLNLLRWVTHKLYHLTVL